MSTSAPEQRKKEEEEEIQFRSYCVFDEERKGSKMKRERNKATEIERKREKEKEISSLKFRA